jgi:hypothetical protein
MRIIFTLRGSLYFSTLSLVTIAELVFQKWWAIRTLLNYISVDRIRLPFFLDGSQSVVSKWRGTQNEKGKACKALFGGSIPSRASTSPTPMCVFSTSSSPERIRSLPLWW